MANRTGTYIAFDGLGETDPSKSDFKYYGTIQMWDASKSIDFKFVNSHEKTDAVRDTSKRATLEARIQDRLRVSKNMIVILSPQTRKSGSMLVYEIEQAVDTYGLPLIAAYPEYKSVLAPALLSDRWPTALASRIGNEVARVIHIAFRKEPLLDAIGRFSVPDEMPPMALSHYSKDTHRSWGLLNANETADRNYPKPPALSTLLTGLGLLIPTKKDEGN